MIAKVTRPLSEPLGPVAGGNGFTSDAVSGPTPLLQILWRRRWWAALMVVLCLAAAVLYLARATPIYTSQARLLVEQSGPKVMGDTQAGPKSASYLYTQAQVITSSPILSGAIDSAGLAGTKTFAQVDNPLAFLKKTLRAEVGKKDDVLAVSFDSPYPQEAADVVNAVIDEYTKYSANQKRNTAAELLKILEKQKKEREAELRAFLEKMLEFKRENGALSFSNDKGNIILDRLSSLSTALTQVQLELVQARADLETAKAVLKDPDSIRNYVEAHQSKGVNAMDKEYGELMASLQQHKLSMSTLGYGAGGQNPRVETIRQNIRMIEDEILKKERRMVQAHVADAEQALRAAEQKEVEIRQAFEQQQKEALDLNAKESEVLRLQSDVRRTEKMCDLLDERIKEINVNDDASSLNIQVLEVGRAEDKPTKPRRTMVLAAALLMGLMLGSGAAIGRDWMDQKLRTAEQIVEALGLPVLGVVPHIHTKTPSANGQTVHLEPMSDVAESYRTIRTTISFGSAAEAKTILFTSPAPGDGKSTSASNYAIALAQAGYRTLLIDADFRKPMQHRIFGLDNQRGMSTVIAGGCKLREVVKDTATPGLYVLPCGPVPPNPAEILNGKRFAQVMEALCGAFDRVVLDSPPVMPVTDARILAAAADVTVLVLRADKSTRHVSVHARDGLQSVGADIAGVVVNDVSRRVGGYGYGYGYYGTYGRDGDASRTTLTATTGTHAPLADPENLTVASSNHEG